MPIYLEWLTLGVFLILLELILPGTYLVWFGFSAISLATIVYIMAPISIVNQLILFAILSVIFALIGWKIYGRFIFKLQKEDKRHLNDPVAQYIGKIVTVSDIKDGRIHVSVGDTVWLATSEDTLNIGDNVLILGSDNNIVLNVKKYIDKKEKEE